MNKIELLNNQFNNEYYNYNDYIITNKEIFKIFVKDLINQISNLDFKKSSIELIKENGVKINLLFDNNIMLMVTKLFDGFNDLNKNYVVFSIFKEKELIISDITDLQNLIKGFNEYLK